MAEQETESTGNAERDRLMSQAYGVAQKRLREAHKDEFNGYYAEECKARGIDWVPKKSKQEQALDQITGLLSAYPDLAEKLVERLSVQQ
jgi:hypothetical protein